MWLGQATQWHEGHFWSLVHRFPFQQRQPLEVETSILRVRGWGSSLRVAPPHSESKSLSLRLVLMPSQSFSIFLRKPVSQTSLWRNSENPCFVFYCLLEFCFLLHNTCFNIK